MANLIVPAKEFKRFNDPFPAREGEERPVKYRFYVRTDQVPEELGEWMSTNPRNQNLVTSVAKAIRASLAEDNKSFHMWNRGILISAAKVTYDNRVHEAEIVLEDPQIHGDIDGGHTLRIILDQRERGLPLPEQYVEFEVITGLTTPEELAEARNTSVTVDTKSMEELKDSFRLLKRVMEHHQIQGNYYYQRIEFRQNQMRGQDNSIDIREIVGILNMFNQELYPIYDQDLTPIQSFSGREVGLRRFLQMGLPDDATAAERKEKRDQVIWQMTPIIQDVFELWDYIECNFAKATAAIAKRYGSKKYSNYDAPSRPNALFSNSKLRYTVPRGILYPLVGAFRALVRRDENGVYYWAAKPITAWNDLGGNLAELVMSSAQELSNPTAIGKSKPLWNSLFLTVSFYAQTHGEQR